MNKIAEKYEELLKLYGARGWWPLLDLSGRYHPGDYSYPKNQKQVFEICVGAILTQNTAWKNVEKALLNSRNYLDPKKILNLSQAKLAKLINSAGYFNQKAKKLRFFTEFFIDLDGKAPTREELLGIWGIGPETADSILLYAYKVPTFVVDAYTKRVFPEFKDLSYDAIKACFEEYLVSDYTLYQEYHALIVEHAKRSRSMR